MKRRVFIAIDLPPELKQEIAGVIQQWRWLPIRWLDPQNWHITVIPPVYLEDDQLRALAGILAANRLGPPFALCFSRIILAPAHAPARMIWLEGDAPRELDGLKETIAALWSSNQEFPPLAAGSRVIKPHITLARFRPGELRELEEKTRTLGAADFCFDVADVAVMESHLKRGGAEYKTIRTFAV